MRKYYLIISLTLLLSGCYGEKSAPGEDYKKWENCPPGVICKSHS